MFLFYMVLVTINVVLDTIYKFFEKRVGMINLTVSEKNDLIEVYDCLFDKNSFKKRFLNFISKFYRGFSPL